MKRSQKFYQPYLWFVIFSTLVLSQSIFADQSSLTQQLLEIEAKLASQAKSKNFDTTPSKILPDAQILKPAKQTIKPNKQVKNQATKQASRTSQPNKQTDSPNITPRKIAKVSQQELSYFQLEKNRKKGKTIGQVLNTLNKEIKDLKIDLYAMDSDMDKVVKSKQNLQRKLDYHSDYLITMFDSQNNHNAEIISQIKQIDQAIFEQHLSASSYLSQENGNLKIVNFGTFNTILSNNNNLVVLGLEMLGQKWQTLKNHNQLLLIKQEEAKIRQSALSEELTLIQNSFQPIEKELNDKNSKLNKKNSQLNLKINIINSKNSQLNHDNQSLKNKNKHLVSRQLKEIEIIKKDNQSLLQKREEEEMSKMLLAETLLLTKNKLKTLQGTSLDDRAKLENQNKTLQAKLAQANKQHQQNLKSLAGTSLDDRAKLENQNKTLQAKLAQANKQHQQNLKSLAGISR